MITERSCFADREQEEKPLSSSSKKSHKTQECNFECHPLSMTVLKSQRKLKFNVFQQLLSSTQELLDNLTHSVTLTHTNLLDIGIGTGDHAPPMRNNNKYAYVQVHSTCRTYFNFVSGIHDMEVDTLTN